MRSMPDIRRVKALAIARSIYATENASRQSIATAVGISVPTTSVICNEMVGRDTLVEMAQRKGQSGRPPYVLALNPRQGFFVALEISEGVVSAEAFDSALIPLTQSRAAIDPRDRSPDHVARLARALVAEESLKRRSEPLLGVSAAGPSAVLNAAGFPGSAKNPLGDAVVEALRYESDPPPFYCSPSHALVAAELWSHPERSNQDFVVVDLGMEVGVGIVLEGHPYRGQSNAAGAWGHSVLIADGRVCRCGSRGCVESYVGAHGIIQTLRESHPSSPLARSDDPALALAAVHDAGMQGDPDALSVYRQVGSHLGLALGSLINILNPQAVVVDGLVASELGELLLKSSMPLIQKQALAVPLLAVEFDFRTSNQSRVAFGLAALMLERHLETKFSETGSQRDAQRRTATRAVRELARPSV